jgi:hypothetical protein
MTASNKAFPERETSSERSRRGSVDYDQIIKTGMDQ